ncbi:GAF domain-containing protein [Clostridium sp.]|uniref:GAF domain-containing protein n=1 Tax=Clostridium sp. TaxID=1506 RepID=UPI002846912F|nr:GAF domain-containing protein [Clostridium sp.]MDR3597760.1 GAF domain-containing protein [Clostridium sp.]
MDEILQRLFHELKTVLHTDEFGYHAIIDDRLVPVYKNDTEGLNLEKWKMYHANNPVIIEDDIVLTEVLRTQKSISIDNTNDNSDYPLCYGVFGIFSIYLVPVIKDDNVVGLIDMPVMGRYYSFKNDIKEQCELIIRRYNELLINNGMI